MINELKKYDIVSFDIFDTLIKRMVSSPYRVFDLVEKEYNKFYKSKEIINFRKNRIECEKNCRKNSAEEEITLDNIYNELLKFYEEKELRKLKELEKNIEINICKFNSEIKEIYKWCLANNKKIIITSDMYLDKKTIVKILNNNDIKYYKLYLSSDLLKTKRTGNIFEFILDDLKIDSKKLIHIGDNKKSDFYSPKKLGIKSLLWKNNNKYKESDNLAKEIVECFLVNRITSHKNDIFEDIGYNEFGPLLMCYSKWLLNNLKLNKINKVFFLSRDGYIMKRAFDVINNNPTIESKYFYASRRSIIVPSLKDCGNINEILSRMYISKHTKIKSILKKIGLDDTIDENFFLSNYGVNINEEITLENIYTNEKYNRMFNDLYKKIINNSKFEYDNFNKYRNKMGFFGKLAIVDIGWFGNMQNALENLQLDSDICGYYIGIEPRKNYQSKYNMHGFLFETNRNYNIFLKEHNFNSIFEMLFLGHHGSVKRFNISCSDLVELYKYEYSDSKQENDILKLQNNAIEFVKDFYNSNLLDYIDGDLTWSFDYLCHRFLNPNLKTATVFGNFFFLDDENNCIAKPSRFSRYINPANLVRDYKMSAWRIGFLKRLLKISLPYYDINMFIRRKYLKRKETKNE